MNYLVHVKMEENLHEAPPPHDHDCGKREGPMSPVSSKFAGDSLRNVSQHEEDLGFPVDEPKSTEWTNEKHCLYLKFMEATFVKQLYNQKNSAMDLLGWHSGEFVLPYKNLLPYKNSLSGNHNSSGQFKVLRDGCWQNSERDQHKLSTSGKSDVVLESRWIRCIKSPLKRQEITSPQRKEKGALSTKSMHFTQWRRHRNGLVAISKQPLASHTLLCCQDSVASSEEVSDQNFVDEDHEEERLSSVCRAKRMKVEAADVSSKYQVVPSGNFPSAMNSKEKRASTGGYQQIQSYQQPENMDGFVPRNPSSEPEQTE
ncbi:hypothetical protein L1049_024493 [Liquidambar formosana]|uniref:Uncharacterized protein n=1 Tax=Liquidambar formosana TaxID=63359 RepID=A0AAP0S125_LIQFO